MASRKEKLRGREEYIDEDGLIQAKFNHRFPIGVHVPNKNEAKMMRKLRAKTGMTVEQIRGLKEYRQILAEAAGNRRPPKQWWEGKSDDEILKHQIARQLFLPVDHFIVLRAWKEEKKRREEQAIINKLSQPW